MKKFVYADNAATSRITSPVLDAMMPWLTQGYGNPSSIYSLGRSAKHAVEDARATVARCIGALPQELYFTGCGSESDNWALKGVMHSAAKKGKRHMITSVFEHHAILHTCQALEKEGFDVTYLPIDADGYVHVEDLKKAIRDDTALVSIMYANNEIGTIQPIPEIGELCRAKGVLFHTDAVQAVGHVEIDVQSQNIDMLSLSGHKLHAPKGVGALYIRKGVSFPNLIDGGEQERSRRAGTENVASIVGLGTAMELACTDIADKERRVAELRDMIIDGLSDIPLCRLNGGRDNRLAGNVNMSFLGAEGESLLMSLDLCGVCASSGSACTTGSLDPSHVLLALGICHEVAHGSLRITINEQTTIEDAQYIIESVRECVASKRAMSPLWDDIQSGKKSFELNPSKP